MSFYRLLGMLILLLFVTGCYRNVPRNEVYAFHSHYAGTSAPKDLRVEMNESGVLNIIPLHDKSVLPVGSDLLSDGVTYYPDAPGATHIEIRVSKSVGHTRYAGLDFQVPVILNISQAGVLSADRVDVCASDHTGKTWISRKVCVDQQFFIAFVAAKP